MLPALREGRMLPAPSALTLPWCCRHSRRCYDSPVSIRPLVVHHTSLMSSTHPGHGKSLLASRPSGSRHSREIALLPHRCRCGTASRCTSTVP